MWEKDLSEDYGIELQDKTIKNVVNVMTNEFPSGSGKKDICGLRLYGKNGTGRV